MGSIQSYDPIYTVAEDKEPKIKTFYQTFSTNSYLMTRGGVCRGRGAKIKMTATRMLSKLYSFFYVHCNANKEKTYGWLQLPS